MPLTTNYEQHWPDVVHAEFEVHDIDTAGYEVDEPAVYKKGGNVSWNPGLLAIIAKLLAVN